MSPGLAPNTEYEVNVLSVNDVGEGCFQDAAERC